MSRELLQQALDALKVSAWDHIHAVGKQALIDAIIDRLAQPDAEPVAWKCAKCGNTSDCEGVTVGDNWCNSCAVCGEMKPLYATAPPAAPAPGDMVMVPLKFVQDFNTLAHNYCLRAVPPDYYSGTEADAFQHAYSRCGSDLRRLREILAAAPAPAVPDLKHKPTVQRLMDLARKFRATPGDLYDGAYKELQQACYEALSAAPAVPADQWKAAIDDELVCCHIGTTDSFPDAKAALKNLIDWHVSVALDPAVSSDAQALIDKGKSAAPAVREPLIDEMDAVASKYAHKLALDLECVLSDYNGKWWGTAMQTIGEYRMAMNRIHEQESPTHMGEPVLPKHGIGGGGK